MSKNNIIEIDLSKWQTPINYAKYHNIPIGTLSQQIKRTREGKTPNPLPIWEIPELNNLILIRK